MLFFRWQGLSTQSNTCNPTESRGGFCLNAGGIGDGIAISHVLLAKGSNVLGGSIASGSVLLLGMGWIERAGFDPRSLETFIDGLPNGFANGSASGSANGITGGIGYGIALLRDRTASSGNGSTWTQNILHALFKTLNIRDRQSHARRLCRITP